MASYKVKKDEYAGKYNRATAKTKIPGVTLDLDRLRNLYPDNGCKLRIIIMEDGDKWPPDTSILYRLHVPKKNKTSNGGKRMKTAKAAGAAKKL